MWLLLVALTSLFTPPSAAAVDQEALLDDDFGENQEQLVFDPLEPVNRVFFRFNDRLYFWVLKPVGKVYTAVLADEDVRGAISAAFHNILAPVRVVNNLLQGKIRQSGTEMARFAINTVLGAGGLGDPAAVEFGLAKADEDLGQTLGFYGMGEGIYLCWPFLGPSTARDTLGMAGDYFLNPLNYILVNEPKTQAGLTALKAENAATLKGKEYESLVREAFDPYISARDIYYQHRRSLITATVSAEHQSKGDGGRPQEPCPEFYGNGLFHNLLKARQYQQCLNNMGAKASVHRTQNMGRALYRVKVDAGPASGPQVAMMMDVAE
ncbi:MAG: VacJ family lipoprotein [Deltaproteobacteria bacterium]|nr:VacJ family lipoprotein [Deltaproteobacteria bacterium]